MAASLSAGLQQADGHPFDKWHLWLVDERCVSHDHPDSNFALIAKHILDPIGKFDRRQVHALDLDALQESPAAAAASYERALRRSFGLEGSADIPVLDVILLGMGPDGVLQLFIFIVF